MLKNIVNAMRDPGLVVHQQYWNMMETVAVMFSATMFGPTSTFLNMFS